MNGETFFISEICTRLDSDDYWCPVAGASPQPVYGKTSEEKYKWGECALSCMETYNETSVLMTAALLPDVITHLKFASQPKHILHEFTFKGHLSDIYIWNR